MDETDQGASHDQVPEGVPPPVRGPNRSCAFEEMKSLAVFAVPANAFDLASFDP